MVADVVPIKQDEQPEGKQNPTCRVCGVEVEVEGYAELSGKWKESMDRMCVCDEHQAKQKLRDEEELRLQRRTLFKGALDASRIPAEMRGKSWGDLHETEEREVVDGDKTYSAEEATTSRKAALLSSLEWARDEERGLILAGRVGVGKSWFAAVAAQALIYNRVKALDPNHMPVAVMPIRWINVPELIQKARGEIGSDRRRDAEKVLDGTFGLVLDDIDKVNPTQFSLDLLFEAVENRINKGRPLLVTTNKNYVGLRDHVGDPLASRLRGYCVGRRIIGNDRRR